MTHFNFKWDSTGNEFNLYENDALVAGGILEPEFALLMDDKPDGQYYYKVTEVITINNPDGTVFKDESDFSSTITQALTRPKPPTGLTLTVG